MKGLLAGSILCLLLLSSCVQNLAGTVRTEEEQKQTLLETTCKEHKKALLGIGEIADRRQEQSRGLGLVANKSFERYANKILEKLKQASGLQDIPGQVYLKAENAWSVRASASGNIYVPLGVLGDINSEDVFAALLSHELVHVIKNHADADLVAKATKKSVYFASLLNQYSGRSGADSDAFRISLGSFAAAEVFLCPSWSRHQESVADLMGLDILVRAGYSANAMASLLEVMEVLDERNRLELKKRREIIARSNEKMRDKAVQEGDYVSFMKSSVSDAAVFASSKLKELMAGHRSGKTRLDELRKYKRVHYRRLPRKKFQKKSWLAALNTEDMKRVVQGLEFSFAAHEQLMKSETEQATKTIKRGLNKSTKTQSYIRTVFSDIREAQGNTKFALMNHQFALNGEYPSFNSLLMVNREKLAKKSAEQGKIELFTELMSEFDDYGKPPEYFAQMIVLAEELGLKDKSVMLAAECTAKYAADGVSCGAESVEGESSLTFKNFFKAYE